MQYQHRRTLPDFDVLTTLARKDPRALEDLRQRLTNDVIRHAGTVQSRRRLRGLQFTIDLERKRAPDALSACVRLSQLMHESLAELNRALVEPPPPTDSSRQATVLSFPLPTQDV